MLRISAFKRKEIKKAALIFLEEELKDVVFDEKNFDEFKLDLKYFKEDLEKEKLYGTEKIGRKELLLIIKRNMITKPIVSLLEKRLVNKNLK